MTDVTLKKMLYTLCVVKGISGDETKASEMALSFLKNYCSNAHISHGNVMGTMGNSNENAPHVLLDAHIDQVGLIVTSITDDGFVTVGNIGGLDRRIFPDQHVKLHGTKTIDGIISTLPPHLSNGEEQVQRIEQVRIDTGYSADELKKILHIGDSVTFCGVYAEMMGGKITAPALDDRCGVASILYALDLLQDEEIPCKVTALFSTQEEVGERGARIGCFSANPDIALAVDVSFAGDGSDGTGIMGKGAMIGFSPSLSRKISRDLVKCADENNIPYQYEVMSGTTGTNADQFSTCRDGVRACTVSIPLDYMHTPVEVIDIEDVKNTGLLLANYLRGCREC